MSTAETSETTVESRAPLTRERVLTAAVELGDQEGIEAVSMRKLGQELGVEAMSLYNHVANKEDVLGGMIELVLNEIEILEFDGDWKSSLRAQILASRQVLLGHPWASGVLESRTDVSPATLRYLDGVVAIFRDGGFTLDLIHHAMHVLGSRLLGFSQELFDDADASAASPEETAVMMEQMAKAFPNLGAMILEVSHADDDSVVGGGCDDKFEFEFALDLILDGLDRLRKAHPETRFF